MTDIVVIGILLRIAYIDDKTMEIPDRLTLVLGICGFISCIQNSSIPFTDRILGLAFISVPMYLLCFVIPNAFGGGDIKLTAAMGFYLGWRILLIGVYFGFLIGGIQAAYLLLSKKVRRGEGAHMAFGPALCIGIFIAMLWGTEILQWYFGIFI